VVIPLATQHYMLLQQNLIYTGITRGKRSLVVIGQKRRWASRCAMTALLLRLSIPRSSTLAVF
jgi:exodeoxyribonuclease V alpha subunit